MAQQPPQSNQQYTPPPNQGSSQPTIVINQSGPGFLIRALYFIFIGWWLSGIWILLAWLLNITIVGLPLGLTMLNRIPQVMTLSPGSQKFQVNTVDGVTTVTTGAVQQPMWMRAIYFVLIGWWASLIWIVIAYLLSLSVIGLPFAFLMFNLVGMVTTLRKN